MATDIFVSIPQWVQYLVQGLMIFALLAFTTIILSRTGRSPYFAIFVIVPFLPVIGAWLLAFCKWPKTDHPEGDA